MLLAEEKMRELRSGKGEVSLFGFWWQQVVWLRTARKMVRPSFRRMERSQSDVMVEITIKPCGQLRNNSRTE